MPTFLTFVTYDQQKTDSQTQNTTLAKKDVVCGVVACVCGISGLVLGIWGEQVLKLRFSLRDLRPT